MHARKGRHAVARAAVLLAGVLSAGLVPAVPAVGVTTTRGASDDGRVEAAYPGTSYGSSIRLHADGSPQKESYLRFTSVPSSVSRARLRLFVTDGTADGPALYAVDANWTESGLTWNSRPARLAGISALGNLGRVSTDTWVEFDVTSFVRGRSTVAFRLSPTSSDGIETISSESTQTTRRPQLVVESGTSSPPPTPPPPGTGRPND